MLFSEQHQVQREFVLTFYLSKFEIIFPDPVILGFDNTITVDSAVCFVMTFDMFA